MKVLMTWVGCTVCVPWCNSSSTMQVPHLVWVWSCPVSLSCNNLFLEFLFFFYTTLKFFTTEHIMDKNQHCSQKRYKLITFYTIWTEHRRLKLISNIVKPLCFFLFIYMLYIANLLLYLFKYFNVYISPDLLVSAIHFL